MTFLITGILVFAATGAGFWWCLPTAGVVRPIVNTVAEPYLAIAVAGGFVLSLAAIVLGAYDLVV